MQKRHEMIKVAILSLVTLSLLVGSSLAWLTRNRSTGSNINKMQLDANGLKIDHYNVFQYDYENDRIVNIYNDSDIYEMTVYDSIFTERNDKTLLIFEVFLYNFTQDMNSIMVYVDREQHTTAFNDPDCPYTSNIIYVKCATGGTLGGSVANEQSDQAMTDEQKAARAGRIFYAARDAFVSTAKQTFIEVENNGGTYEAIRSANRITFEIPLSSAERGEISGADGAEKRIPVYFIFDYDPELIRAQKIDNFSNITIIETDLQINYQNDIASFLFEAPHTT